MSLKVSLSLPSLILLQLPQTKEDKWMGQEEEKRSQIRTSKFPKKKQQLTHNNNKPSLRSIGMILSLILMWSTHVITINEWLKEKWIVEKSIYSI